jgi:hypothetical protein
MDGEMPGTSKNETTVDDVLDLLAGLLEEKGVDIPQRGRTIKREFWTAPELAIRWRLKSSRTILRLVERKELPGVKVAGRMRIPHQGVLDYEAANAVNSSEQNAA